MTENTQVTYQSLRTKLQRLRVSIGFLMAIVFVIVSQPTPRSLALGIPIALCGAGIRAWASGHLRKNAELTISGPYGHTRNPLYLGSFIMAAGCAIGGANFWMGSLLVVIFLLIYWPVMQAEAAHLRLLFGDEYRIWADNVPLFIPRLVPYATGQSRRYDLRQYLHHREYRALIGLAIVIGFLAIKVVANY